jgi:hypothetical protein
MASPLRRVSATFMPNHWPRSCSHALSESRRRRAMSKTIHWETPTYEVMRMDSEIGSYQEDDDPGREVPFSALPECGIRTLPQSREGSGT